MKYSVFLCVTLFVVSITGLPKFRGENKKSSCGYASCPSVNPDPNILNVHIVPHSHDDVGWLKTVDEYYYGWNNDIHNVSVKLILDSVVQALLYDPKRRFTYVEIAYFWKWWQEQRDEIREQVRNLVDNGQLDIAGGGWSMNDEAAAHYHSIIDQFTWGFRKLDDTLGKCARPRIGWQIDPFGHSREMASLFSQFGFDGLFIDRLDWRDKNQRLATKSAEMLWQGSPNLGSSSQLFTSILYKNYFPPPGFCFDILCHAAPIDLERAEAFVKFVRKQATFYKSNNIIVTMGGDFHYQCAMSYFTNLDKLIAKVNGLKNNVSIFYSSPACYVKAVNDANKEFPLKTDDFFPYASDQHSYWSGYFTSRPTSKRFERLGNNFLQVAKQLSALTGPEDSDNGLDPMREALGIMQHHDAITGTEKQHVADDYARILTEAFAATDIVAEKNLRKLHQLSQDVKFQSCLKLNISQCELTENKDNVYITVYNSLSRPVSHYVRIPVIEGFYGVYYDGNPVISQMVPIFETILKTPGRSSAATHEVVFEAESLPPLGFKLYQMKRLSATQSNKIENITEKIITVNIDKSGKLKSIILNKKEISITQNYFYYLGAVEQTPEYEKMTSGAYIFRPTSEEAIPVSKNVETEKHYSSLVTEYLQKFTDWVTQPIRIYNKKNFVIFNWIAGTIPNNDLKGKEIVSRFTTDLNIRPTSDTIEAILVSKNVETEKHDGPLVTEYHQKFNDWVAQVIRIYNKQNFVEFNWIVGPIPINDQTGKEIVSRFTTDLKTEGIFYTDSNGRGMIQRIRGERATFKLTHEEPISENYYPITSKITIKDEATKEQVSILNDRAQGGSSLKDGEIELMVHRRLLHDDFYGVGEALNEKAYGTGLVAIGKHYLIVGQNNEASSVVATEKDLAPKLVMEPWIFISPDSCKTPKKAQFSGLKNALPNNLQILTLEPWNKNSILLRLEHIFEKNEDSKLSEPVTVNIKDLFSTFQVLEIEEMALGANQLLSEVNRIKWKSEIKIKEDKISQKLEGTDVTLYPMEIKTFVLKIEPLTIY